MNAPTAKSSIRPNADTPTKEKLLYWFFRFTVWVKGIFGAFELLAGILVIALPHAVWVKAAAFAAHQAFDLHPNDPISHFIADQLAQFSVNSHVFATLYLIVHALTKLVLVWAVLKDKLWAYPWMIAFLGLFIVYQTYEFFVRSSLLMLGLTLFDILIVVLTWHEWHRHRERLRLHHLNLAHKL